MPSPFPPTSPDHSPTASFSLDAVKFQRTESLREAIRRTQRTFLFVNGVPLVIGITLSTFTDIPAAPVYGQLTLGIVWGILQCGLFITTAWLYENQSALWCDPIERSLTSGMPQSDASYPSPIKKSWR